MGGGRTIMTPATMGVIEAGSFSDPMPRLDPLR
jgi:hypothetical protein